MRVGRLITMPEWLNEYMGLVNSHMVSGLLLTYTIKKSRYLKLVCNKENSAYRSVLTELSLKLKLGEINEDYIMHITEHLG